jgi:hypothetical protein
MTSVISRDSSESFFLGALLAKPKIVVIDTGSVGQDIW